MRKRRSARRSSSGAPSAAALVNQNALQALALFIGLDLAADADVGDGGHEDQEASGQGDVRGDARALLGDRLLGDLNQYLLAGFQEVADDGQVGGLRGAARHATALALTALRSCLLAGSATAAPATAIAALLR